MKKITFLLSKYTPEFYDKIAAMPPNGQYMYLKKVMGLKPKIGNNTFADQVDFNINFKKANENFTGSTMEIRKGYRLLHLSL